MQIEQLKNIDDTALKAFEKMIPQLTGRNSYPSREELREILRAGNTFLFLARKNDEILGTLSLVIYKIPTGKKAWIEDVVVDENARGKGVAASLVNHALKVAREKGIEKEGSGTQTLPGRRLTVGVSAFIPSTARKYAIRKTIS